MKLYNKEEHYEYLVDRGIGRSGNIELLKFEILVWNFIARIFNLVRQ